MPARIRFIADGQTCTVFGATFTKSVWTTSHGLADEDVARLATNPTFEVTGFDGVPDAPEPEPEPDPEA
jgi:hypothetical protein